MVLVSHANMAEETDAAAWLAASLAECGVRTWMDLDDLRARSGPAVSAEVAQAIADSALIVLLASGRSMTSPWCQAEVSLALHLGKRVLALALDDSRVPGGMLLLLSLSPPIVQLHLLPKEAWADALRGPFAECGIIFRPAGGAAPSQLPPSARLVAPAYPELQTMPPAAVREPIARCQEARAIGSRNGYNDLSLAYLLLFAGDTAGAAKAASAAASLLPQEPNVLIAQALVLCSRHPVATRSSAIAEEVVRTIRRALALDSEMSQARLLLALVACNSYRRLFRTMPAEPRTLLSLRSGAGMNLGENQRVYDTEGLADHRHAESLEPMLSMFLGR